MRVFSLIAALAFVLTAPTFTWSADLLYVSSSNTTNEVVTYDVSLATPEAIEASRTVIVSGLTNPSGLAFDMNQNLYIANFGLGLAAEGFIDKLSSGGTLSTIAEYGIIKNPQSLAFDAASGALYVANFDNSFVVQKPGSVVRISSDGSITTLPVSVNGPVGIAVDASSNLYVSNTWGNSVLKITKTGDVITLAGSLDVVQPQGIALDASGNLYVANSEMITKITPAGIITKFAGYPLTPISGFLRGLTVGSDGSVFVSIGEGRIQKYSPDGAFQFSFKAPNPGFLAFQPVPEPSTYVLATLAAMTLAVMRRRRGQTALP